MKIHVKNHIKDINECTICKKQIQIIRTQLRLHIRTHTADEAL